MVRNGVRKSFLTLSTASESVLPPLHPLQPAEHSSEQQGIPHAAVFFCDTAGDASVWNGTILRFPWPEMWGRDPYGEGQNLWTDRWIPPESLEMEVNGEWVPVRSAV